MQKIILSIVMANLFGLVLLGTYILTGKSNVVYVDSNKLINSYQGMIDARKVYQQKAGGWKANIDTLTNEVKRQIMDYEKESARMALRGGVSCFRDSA